MCSRYAIQIQIVVNVIGRLIEWLKTITKTHTHATGSVFDLKICFDFLFVCTTKTTIKTKQNRTVHFRLDQLVFIADTQRKNCSWNTVIQLAEWIFECVCVFLSVWFLWIMVIRVGYYYCSYFRVHFWSVYLNQANIKFNGQNLLSLFLFFCFTFVTFFCRCSGCANIFAKCSYCVLSAIRCFQYSIY